MRHNFLPIDLDIDSPKKGEDIYETI